MPAGVAGVLVGGAINNSCPRSTKGHTHECSRDAFFRHCTGSSSQPGPGIGGALHRRARTSRAVDAGDPDSRIGRGTTARRRLQRDHGGREDRRCQALAQRHRTDGHAARRYGRVAGRGGGRPYASKIKAAGRDGKTVPVMHACAHDMHVAWLVGATTLLARARHPFERTAWQSPPRLRP